MRDLIRTSRPSRNRRLATSTIPTLLLAATAMPAASHTLEGPETVVAEPNGHFYYVAVFTTGPGSDEFAYFELSGGSSWCEYGSNTSVCMIADGFCEGTLEEGEQMHVEVEGWLLNTEEPGAVRLDFAVCSSPNFVLETEILPPSTSAPSDDVRPGAATLRVVLGANPARGGLQYRIDLREPADVRTSIVSVSGAILDERRWNGLARGTHEIRWRADGRLGSGVYYLVVQAGAETEARKFVLIQ